MSTASRANQWITKCDHPSQSRFICNSQSMEEIWSENFESTFTRPDLALTIMGDLEALPPPSNLSPSVLSFLDHQLYNKETLAQGPTLVIDLQNQCHELDQSLIELNRTLERTLHSHSSFSDRLHGLLGGVNGKLVALESLTRSQSFAQGLCSLELYKELWLAVWCLWNGKFLCMLMSCM